VGTAVGDLGMAPRLHVHVLVRENKHTELGNGIVTTAVGTLGMAPRLHVHDSRFEERPIRTPNGTQILTGRLRIPVSDPLPPEPGSGTGAVETAEDNLGMAPRLHVHARWSHDISSPARADPVLLTPSLSRRDIGDRHLSQHSSFDREWDALVT
jgi:hypothetical protein